MILSKSIAEFEAELATKDERIEELEGQIETINHMKDSQEIVRQWNYCIELEDKLTQAQDYATKSIRKAIALKAQIKAAVVELREDISGPTAEVAHRLFKCRSRAIKILKPDPTGKEMSDA